MKYKSCSLSISVCCIQHVHLSSCHPLHLFIVASFSSILLPGNCFLSFFTLLALESIRPCVAYCIFFPHHFPSFFVFCLSTFVCNGNFGRLVHPIFCLVTSHQSIVPLRFLYLSINLQIHSSMDS